MKGVVYNLLEEAVVEKFGADIWDDLLDDAGVAGAYTSLGNYTDEEMIALVDAAAAKLDDQQRCAAMVRRTGDAAAQAAIPRLLRASQFIAQLRSERQQHHPPGSP